MNNCVVEYDFSPPVTIEGGFLDRVRVEKIGTIRVYGWSSLLTYYPSVQVLSGTQAIKESNRYRLYRPDVDSHESGQTRFCGFCLEYFAQEVNFAQEKILQVVLEGNKVIFEISHTSALCGYVFLSEGKKVFSRQDIYKSAKTPPTEVSSVVLDLILENKGPMLDFGCGTGVYVKELRQRGVKASGVDLNIDWVSRNIPLRIRPFIYLYDGRLPTKYKDESFSTVLCIETLEHIENYLECICEIKRLTSDVAIFTVPDAEAITVCSPDYVVPWHMLEAQHVNFFTQKNLQHILSQHFSTIDFIKIHPHQVNQSLFYGNLCAICHK